MMIGDAGESERAADLALIKQAQDQAVVALETLFAHNGWSVNIIWQ